MPRTRGNGAGSLYYVEGRRLPWAAAVTIGWTPSDRPVRRTRYATTRVEAERLLDALVSGKVPPRANARKLAPETKPITKRTRHSRDIPARMRFLVLQRDGFRCTYCGAAPPDVTLEVDHIVPAIAGGATDPANLTTACWDCNIGKGDLSA